MDLAAVRETGAQLREQVHKVVVVQDKAIGLMLVSLLCEAQ